MLFAMSFAGDAAGANAFPMKPSRGAAHLLSLCGLLGTTPQRMIAEISLVVSCGKAKKACLRDDYRSKLASGAPIRPLPT